MKDLGKRGISWFEQVNPNTLMMCSRKFPTSVSFMKLQETFDSLKKMLEANDQLVKSR